MGETVNNIVGNLTDYLALERMVATEPSLFNRSVLADWVDEYATGDNVPAVTAYMRKLKPKYWPSEYLTHFGREEPSVKWFWGNACRENTHPWGRFVSCVKPKGLYNGTVPCKVYYYINNPLNDKLLFQTIEQLVIAQRKAKRARWK